MFQHLKEKIQDRLHQDSTTAALVRSVPVTDVDFSDSSFNPLIAALELSDRTFNYFYNPSLQQFCSPHNERGTIDSQHGYVVWPVSIAFWAIADVAKRSQRQEDLRDLDRAHAALERHWNPTERGYCAWLMYEGNRDLYYDDNAHAGNALISAYHATSDRKFLERARDILLGIISKGWDRSENPGGIMWHIDDPNSRNACSTLAVAMFACRLALLDIEKDFCLDLARSCITFSEKHLIDADDGLIIDAIRRDNESSAWRSDNRKYTYNTGFAIEAFLLWSKLSGDQTYFDKANKLASIAVNPQTSLFDDTVPDLQHRHWRDSTYFAHHLVEALVLMVAANGPSDPTSVQISSYLARFAAYVRTHIYDTADHMYFRELRMYRIDQERTDKFNEEFGVKQALTPEAEERENGDGPLEKRRLVKTLIANASVARMFACLSDIQKQIIIPPACLEHYRHEASEVGQGNNRPVKPLASA